MDKRRLTLTFDNGPIPEVTDRVLDSLSAYGHLVTFFAIGQVLALPGNRAVLERAREMGHQVGNHTMNHRAPFGTFGDPMQSVREIKDAQEVIGDLAGTQKLFRPMGGGGNLNQQLLNPSAVEHLLEENYTCVLWNSVPHDWEDTEGWPERALADIVSRDWTVLVLHDTGMDAMQQLPRFLRQVADLGVEVTQEFPTPCVPIRGGRLMWPLDALMQLNSDHEGSYGVRSETRATPH